MRRTHLDTQTSNPADNLDEPCRLDVWLYRTRLLKTRSGATKLINKGKVRVTRNGVTQRTKKPHTLIRHGDGVTFMRGTYLIDVIMLGAGTRRGPAPEAEQLYNNIGKKRDKMGQDSA